MKRNLMLFSVFFCLVNICTLWALPIITSLSPNFGPSSGGNSVTINGTGFTGATAVSFGSVPATSFLVNSDGSITAIAPSSIVRDATVTVTTPSGTSSSVASLANSYAYQGNWTAYIALQESGSILPINTGNESFGVPITAVPFANFIAITPNATTAVVTSLFNTIAIVDLLNNLSTQINTGSSSRGVAISPDGKTAYVVNFGVPSVSVIDLASKTLTTAIPLASTQPSFIAITPDGTTAYVTNNDINTVTPINLATNTPGTDIPVGIAPEGIAITPDGLTAYVVNNGGSVTPITIATNTPGTPILVGTDPGFVAITADGTKALVLNIVSQDVTPIDIATNTAGAPISLGLIFGVPEYIAITPDGNTAFITTSGGFVILNIPTRTIVNSIHLLDFARGVIISPDQSPIASFTITPPNLFDASKSVTPVGTIVNYAWNFGDGATLTTSSPITTHTYAAPGVYTIVLTVTNSAGTSTTQTYTGQVVSNHGSLLATLSETFVVAPPTPPAPPAPPSNLVGVLIKNKWLTQTDCIHRLSWDPSPDPTVVAYMIFRNGVLIATVPANGPLVFEDHNRGKHEVDTYILRAVNANGLQSTPISVTVP